MLIPDLKNAGIDFGALYIYNESIVREKSRRRQHIPLQGIRIFSSFPVS